MAFEPGEIRSLADYPYIVVRVACYRCPRRQGSYRLARLAAKFGAEMPLDMLLDRITFDCGWRHGPERRRGNQYVPVCQAHFPDITRKAPRPPDLPVALCKPRLIQGGKA